MDQKALAWVLVDLQEASTVLYHTSTTKRILQLMKSWQQEHA